MHYVWHQATDFGTDSSYMYEATSFTFKIEDFFPSADVYNSNSVVIRSRGK